MGRQGFGFVVEEEEERRRTSRILRLWSVGCEGARNALSVEGVVMSFSSFSRVRKERCTFVATFSNVRYG